MVSLEKHVVVIGAGIVGVSTAIWLRRMGIDVTLVDRNSPGDKNATSYGNAGVLASCSVAPVTAPGLLVKGPRMALDPNFPLFLRWSYLPRMLPWLLRYMSHANDKDTRRIAAGLAPLTADSVEQHQALAAGTEAESWIQSSDYSFVYPDRAAFEADSYTWMLRKTAGFEPDILEGPEVREFEPSLSEDLKLLAVMRDHGFCRNPGAYVSALATEAQRLGASVRQCEVKDLELVNGRVTTVTTNEGPLLCSNVVLATGVWSAPLAQKLGISVPMETERGYHMEFANPEHGPTTPLMVTTGKFVATPMQGGLRCAGVVEFGGLEAKASKAPLDLLQRKVKESFPKLEFDTTRSWLGHRPAPTDSLPLLGEIGQSGVLAGFGHHHIGLTAGPKTGRILANLVAGKRSDIDLGIYNPHRF